MRKVKTVVILLSLALISFPVLSLQPEESSAGSNFVDDLLFTPAPRDALDAYSTEAPTLFSPNLGQLDNSIVQFYVRGGGFWVARDGIWFSLEGRREKG